MTNEHCTCAVYQRSRLTPTQRTWLGHVCEQLDISGPGANVVEESLVRGMLTTRANGHFADCPLAAA